MRRSLALWLIGVVLTACDDTIWLDQHSQISVDAEGWCGVVEILEGSCLGCHGATDTPQGGLNLASDPYAALVGVPSALYPDRVLVEAGSSAESFLIDKVRDTQGDDEGTAMPPGSGLSDELTALMADWIDEGAEETVCSTATTSTAGASPHDPNYASTTDGIVPHGTDAKLQVTVEGQACIDCHGEPDAETDAWYCDTCHNSIEGVTDWRTDCTFCHGGQDGDTTGAPPVEISGVDEAASARFRAHQVHVQENIKPAYGCEQCHVTPTSVLDVGHFLIDDDTPGVAEAEFSGGVSPDGSWDADSGACFIYCHGDGIDPELWEKGETFADHYGEMSHATEGISCSSCHPDETSDQIGWAEMSGRHERHLAGETRAQPAELLACEDCHGEVVSGSAGKIAVSDPTLHVNGAADLSLPGGFVYADNFCTGTCHDEDHSQGNTEGRSWYSPEVGVNR